jgi:hypothetical protein
VTNAPVTTRNTHSIDLIDHANMAIFDGINVQFVLHLDFAHVNAYILIKVLFEVVLLLFKRRKYIWGSLNILFFLGCISLSYRLNFVSIRFKTILSWRVKNIQLSFWLSINQTRARQLVIDMTNLNILEVSRLPLSPTAKI